ncbi:IucA/IucC family C-terminal-domain containing protein [Alkalihalobacillus sp. BA299]|uniref:IucA/IucC family C-terminal-domain containing protein n=1 Tax=Alkalihalobacillus sp. BA299 TaxID=2815938 RepID=UPI001ADC0A66|nr:IucA/IucC family C-terminal-domain containing protein [Alkalihalobacillus sp. BA299]
MREVTITLDEKLQLEEYRVCFKGEDFKGRDNGSSSLAIPVVDMFDRDQLANYLNMVQKELQAPDLKVAASAFSKRYSYLIVVPAFYSLYMLNKQLNMSVNNLYLMSSASSERWLPRIYLKDQRAYTPDTTEERECSRNQLIESIFVNHLSPLWNELSEVCKIPKPILWENTAVYTFWIFESLLQRTDIPSELRDAIKVDFEFLLYEAQASIFKSLNENPIRAFYCEKTNLDGKQVRVRKTCCFYYALSKDGDMCNGCPRKGCN